MAVICGGRGGVMQAAAQGASEAGGIVIGLLPEEDTRAANPYLTVALPTGLGEMRNALIARSAICLQLPASEQHPCSRGLLLKQDQSVTAPPR